MTTSTTTSLRFVILCLTILAYGCLGYPTPDQPGVVEIVIGVGLILSFGLPQAAFALLITPHAEPLWMKAGRLLLIYGLSVPLITGILLGNHISAIIRDLFPFMFLLLPFFAYDLYGRLSKYQAQTLLYIILGAGMLFALRGIYVLKDGIDAINDIDALYLVNAPTVLFSAIYLLGFMIITLSLRRFLFPLILGLSSIIPMISMGLVLQRASFGAIMISGLFLSGFVLRQNLLRFIMLCIVGGASLYLFWEQALPYLNNLSLKNQAVGSNMRFFELYAVWERIAEESVTALFGQGWGGTVQSPAVGDLTVNYTHGLISASLLKTGLVGTFLTILYLGALSLRFPVIYKSSPALALALFWPFVIDIFLYASYKSLDFGFILLLIACYRIKEEKYKAEHIAQNTDHQQGLSTGSRRHGAHRAGTCLPSE